VGAAPAAPRRRCDLPERQAPPHPAAKAREKKLTDRSVEHYVAVPNNYYAQRDAVWHWHYYWQHHAAMQEPARRRRNTLLAMAAALGVVVSSALFLVILI